MKRRDFIKSTALIAVATGAAGVSKAASLIDDSADESQVQAGKLIVSAPVLQNYAETSMGITFAVSDMANGYVLISEHEDMANARKVMCGGFRTTDISDKVIQVRVTGLKPATKYYYRIGADRIEYKGGYKMKIIGNEENSQVYHFTTAGKAATPHFCVINDTHARWEAFRRVIEKVAELSPSCVIWNGDASNSEETVDDQTRIFLNPEIERRDYASTIPYLFCPGNHDSRGWANRHLERMWMFRQPEERKSRDWDLGRNFAVRMGDVALIGLDTAEDKLDTNPLFAGLFNSEKYREAQTEWLRDALAQPEIKKAPYLVTFCHIPLFDSNPRHNPGDVRPNDADPQYTTDYALWQRTCAQMWAPLLEKAKCQLVITAHQHCYRYDAPTKQRPWAQIVGGGPNLAVNGKTDRPERFPTVIEGKVTNAGLSITVYNMQTYQVQDRFTFKAR